MVVIVDTNLARNENSFSQLLGFRSQLERISAGARLMIPKVVIDEIIAQKHLAFEKEVATLKRSGVLKLAEFSCEILDDLAFDDISNKIRNDKSVDYDLLPLPPADSIFPQLYDWAIAHSAPFDEKSDKGFKDACIVASIEYFIEHHGIDEEIVLCTDDGRMASYFEHRSDVRVENDLNKVLPSPLLPKAVSPVRPMADRDVEGTTVVELAAVDSMIGGLRDSSSFAMTHELIKRLAENSRAITGRQEIEILDIALANDQVAWILKDDDVCDFIKPIFLRHKDELTDSSYGRYIDCFNLPDEREEERGEPFFTSKEKHTFRAFADMAEKNITYKVIDAHIEDDPQSLLKGLDELLDAHRLDDYLTSIKPLASVLIDGYVEVKPGAVPLDVVRGFATMLANSSPRKREAIVTNLVMRLRDIEDEILF